MAKEEFTYYGMVRGWMDHRLLREPKYSKREAWCWLIEKAAFADHQIPFNGKIISVKRGEVPVSLRKLEEAWGWSLNRVRRFLNGLADERMVVIKTDAAFSIIIVCNYDIYQSALNKTNTATDTPADTATDTATDTNIKREIKKDNKKDNKKEEEVSSARGYFFEGEIIKINQSDFNKFASAYSAIPDLLAELFTIDTKFVELGVDTKKWFLMLKAWLNKSNARYASVVKEQQVLASRPMTEAELHQLMLGHCV